MKAVVQRVKNCSVKVSGAAAAHIDFGLLVYLGIQKDDTYDKADYLAKKIAQLRIFEDRDGKMNVSVRDVNGSMLVVSQFTLCADTAKGNRPSFNDAEVPERAEKFINYFSETAAACYNIPVEQGIFGARMEVEYTNEGPVTILLEV